MIPLRDANPTRRTPVVTFGLIAMNVFAFLAELRIEASSPAALDEFFGRWGAVPAAITASIEAGDLASPAMIGILTSLFLHGGWLHLGGNMLFLWIFGNNIEDRLGHLRFLGFYLLGGVVAALAQVWIEPGSTIPLVGASGAIAAALGAYIVIYPRARILSLVFFGWFFQLVEIRAIFVLGYWFILQLVDGLASLGASTAQGGVAFFAHIGGFIVGAAAGLAVRDRGDGA